MREASDKKVAHMQSTVTNNMNAAKRSGDDKKLKQAASRKKKIEDRSGMEVSAKGGRFKLNRDLPGYHLTSRPEIEVPKFDPPMKMEVPQSPADLRFPGSLVAMEKVAFAYPSAKAYTLFDIDLVIHPGDRVGIVGLNGAGKSTLVKLIIGPEDSSGGNALTASRGTMTRHPRARIRLFSQHSVEALEARGARDNTLTGLKEVLDTASADPTAPKTLSEQEVRALLGGLGLPGRLASDVPISALSGGQRGRLALAKIFASTPPHLLILDEVTTHPDADSVTALGESLKAYQGALMVVSHDRAFMRYLIDGESIRSKVDTEDDGDESSESDSDDDGSKVGRVYMVSKSRLKRLEGGMREYVDIAEGQTSKM